MTTTPQHNPLVETAHDTVEQLQCRTECAQWLGVLASSIRRLLEDEEVGELARMEQGKTLASLAQYLAHDLTNDLMRDTSGLQAAVDAAKATE